MPWRDVIHRNVLPVMQYKACVYAWVLLEPVVHIEGCCVVASCLFDRAVCCVCVSIYMRNFLLSCCILMSL